MSNYEFKVKIKYFESGFESADFYDFKAKDFPEFRTEFLKRFGNFVSTNKNNRQKATVKEFSYIAINTKQFINFVNTNTDFEISILSTKEVQK